MGIAGRAGEKGGTEERAGGTAVVLQNMLESWWPESDRGGSAVPGGDSESVTAVTVCVCCRIHTVCGHDRQGPCLETRKASGMGQEPWGVIRGQMCMFLALRAMPPLEMDWEGLSYPSL